MNAQATGLYYQYLLRRDDVLQVQCELEEALAEDHRENADMFDIHAKGFTGKKHPNKTMRRLEARLAQMDGDFLCLLAALFELGMELSCGEEFDTPQDIANTLAEVYGGQQARFHSAAYLAADLTTPKAQHQLGRLQASLALLQALAE